jgi:hypothetical protein
MLLCMNVDSDYSVLKCCGCSSSVCVKIEILTNSVMTLLFDLTPVDPVMNKCLAGILKELSDHLALCKRLY